MSAGVCPFCGSTTTLPILYGLPGPEMERQAWWGEVVVGGCVVTLGDPDRRCVDCGYEFVGATP